MEFDFSFVVVKILAGIFQCPAATTESLTIYGLVVALALLFANPFVRN